MSGTKRGREVVSGVSMPLLAFFVVFTCHTLPTKALSSPDSADPECPYLAARANSSISWDVVESRSDQHRTFWKNSGVDLPESKYMVLLQRHDGFSNIFWRILAYLNDEGRWVVTAAPEHAPRDLRTSVLSSPQSSLLSELLDQPCLRSEPTKIDFIQRPPDSGSFHIEVKTPSFNRSYVRSQTDDGTVEEIANFLNHAALGTDGS